MSRECICRIDNLVIGTMAGIALVFVLGYAKHQDDKDDAAVCAHVEQQARAAAQPETWAQIDKRGREMVAFDRIRK